MRSRERKSMKKLMDLGFMYAILAMVSGVFYREFTKFTGFQGKSVLSVTHVHLFALGTIVFLILGLFSLHTDLVEQKKFKVFLVLYNIGLPFMVIMLYVRGIMQVQALELSKGLNAAIAGMAGISHMIMGAAVIVLFLCLRNLKVTHKAD